MVHQRPKIGVIPVGYGREIRPAMSTRVVANNPVASGEQLELLAPHGAIQHPAVHQNHSGFAVAGDLIVEPAVPKLDEAGLNQRRRRPTATQSHQQTDQNQSPHRPPPFENTVHEYARFWERRRKQAPKLSRDPASGETADSADGRRSGPGRKRRGAETQSRRGASPALTRLPGVPAETSAISRSPAGGEKSASSGYKHPSLSAFSPADVFMARRSRLGYSCSNAGLRVLSISSESEWRGLRSPRAQVAGPNSRNERSRSERLFGPAVTGRHGRPGTRRPLKQPPSSLRLCAFALNSDAVYFSE